MEDSLKQLDKAWDAVNQLLKERNEELASWERYQLTLLYSKGITEAKTPEAIALKSYIMLRARTVELECRIRRRGVFFLRIRLNKIKEARERLAQENIISSPAQVP